MSQEQPSLKISNADLSALSRIGEIASSIGQNVVDVSGFLEDVVTETQTQVAAVQETKTHPRERIVLDGTDADNG